MGGGVPIFQVGFGRAAHTLECMNMSQKDPVPLDANLQALAWARKLRAIAQTGLTFAKDQYDIERYSSIRQIAAEMKGFSDRAV